MEESTLRWPTDKEREEMEEVCSIGEVPHVRWPFCHPANSVKALKGYATDSIGLTTALLTDNYDHLFCWCWCNWWYTHTYRAIYMMMMMMMTRMMINSYWHNDIWIQFDNVNLQQKPSCHSRQMLSTTSQYTSDCTVTVNVNKTHKRF